MKTVPKTTTTHKTPIAQPYTTRAFNAMLDDMYGVALRCGDGRVCFRRDDTQVWQTLTEDDRPVLTLFGRLDLILEAQMADALHGNLYEQVIYRNTEKARKAA